jgi:hypothetical protein
MFVWSENGVEKEVENANEKIPGPYAMQPPRPVCARAAYTGMCDRRAGWRVWYLVCMRVRVCAMYTNMHGRMNQMCGGGCLLWSSKVTWTGVSMLRVNPIDEGPLNGEHPTPTQHLTPT